MIPFNESTRPGGRFDRFNPYRVGLRILLDRLCWDISLQSWIHRNKLAKLNKNYSGKKAVILCNGPSLKDVDFSSLTNVFTFGLNKINLLFRQEEFRPSAVVAVNPLVIQQNSEFFSSTDIPLFLDRVAIKNGIASRDNVHLLHSCDFPGFARDCSVSVFQGFTVTYVALQIAYHMGFDQIALVGCDHDYMIMGNPNTISYNQEKDPGHFCDDYFSPNQPWQYPDLKASEHYYDLARRCYETDRRVIVNASTRTHLDVFPLMKLEKFIHDD